MTQSVFTVVSDVAAAHLPALREALAVIRADPAGNALVPFARFETLHFASLVLAEGPGKLIFEHNVDGTAEDWLAALVAGAGPGLDILYAGSTYPGSADAPAARAWLAERIVRPGAFHIGATGRTLARIRQEAGLHQAIQGFLDAEEAAGGLDGATPAAVRAKVQAFVKADPSFDWAATSPPRETPRERLVNQARLYGTAAGAVALAPALLPALAVAVVVLLVKERLDAVQQGPPDADHVRLLEAEEDFVAQNHLSSVIPVKPGLLRKLTLPVVLYALNLVARVTATKGQLGGIPSIHFAHWSVIDEGRHLVFLSNFDGSWESYLGDFIDKAATGLTAVWSNTVEFPRTRLLAFQGAADGPRFRQWARAHQCSTAAWYTAYPTLTMSTIDDNTSIREDLFAPLDEKGTAAWLARL
ncbi:MAG TPA: hypothetical protein VFO65_08050 [Acidimicrobiales bacterium]|nr:hypothetical protein [Acidimicrobiales bacterium]